MAVLNATLSSLAFPLTKRAIFFSGRRQREKRHLLKEITPL